MSPNSHDSPIAPVQTFRGVNGNLISLDETTDCSQYPNKSGVIKFVLRNERKFSFFFNIILIILVVALCATTNPALPVTLYAILLILQCKSFISSVNIDTLLVVESVGVQIIGKQVFSCHESSTFLPWDTVQDVFINEVITGVREKAILILNKRFGWWKRNYKTCTIVPRNKTRTKMPGIHVRSLGKLDWVEHGNEPVLTIPGAYWLCHKKHIYKFTFKWHKTLRNTEGFAYPKELTKVIRRIIKSQPRQGQQFGTRHLLVTYNHSAWMRQDKMFAMLKFRERTDATAFPRAFVLTVQTLNDSTNEEQSEDKNNTNVDSKKAKNERISVIDEKKGTTENHSPDNQRQNHDRPNSKTEDRVEDVSKSPSSDKSAIIATSSSSRECGTERKKDPGKKGASLRKSAGDVEYLSRNKMRSRRRYTSLEKKNDQIAPDSPAEKGIAADFADLPYQYIIEKEIESSKSLSEKPSSNTADAESSPGPSNKESDLPGKLLPRSPRVAQPETARSADITDLVMEGLMFTIRQDHDTVTVVEQKTKLEMDEVLENSEKAETKEGEKCLLNSSLLRLENLITKIEMSEARSKCRDDTARSPRIITNDTMIKPFTFGSPGDGSSFDYGRYNDAENDRAVTPKKPKPSPLSVQQIERSPIKNMPKFPLVKINLGNARDVLSDELRYDDLIETPEAAKARIEAMDIDHGISTNKEVNESKACDEGDVEEEDEVGLELRYDDQDDCEPDKPEEQSRENDNVIVPEAAQPEVPQDCFGNVCETSVDPKLENVETSPGDHSKTAKNPPRIISNEVVTADQIPPAMQKALKRTRLKRKRSSDESDNFAGDTSPMEEIVTNDEGATALKSAITPTTQHTSQNEMPNEKSTITSPINITGEFYRELASEKTREQPVRRKSLRQVEQDTTNTNQIEEPEVRLDMWKFMQDMTNGAKVVVRRLDLTNFPNGIASGSSLVQ